MTTEQKDLLVKDLCSRLPYGVKLHCISYTMTCIGPYTLNTIVLDRFCNEDTKYVPFDEVKPYLFPLSSMTEEQKRHYHWLQCHALDALGNPLCFDCYDSLDWLNKNHFDYRGLIPMGLANDATGLNIY